jgi:hypothetical protein
MVPDYGPAPALAHALFGCFLASAVALTLGYRPGLFAPLAIVLFFYHYFLQLAVKQSSFERLLAIYLIVLACAGSDRAWAIARRPAAVTTAWPRRVLLMQAAALYFGAGLWKLLNPRWHTGRLLEATLQGMWATPLGFWIAGLGWTQSTWTALSWATIAFELLLGVAILVRRTRVAAVAAGTLFHIANATILAIPEFLVCLVPYPLFMPADVVRRAGESIARRFKMLRWSGRARAS